MVKFGKYTNCIERFLHSDKGQRFFNIAFSLGAAVVIMGALFEILHLPFGGVMLCIGMGTETIMFILTAFDNPPKEYHWEDVFPVLESRDPNDRPNFNGVLNPDEVAVSQQSDLSVDNKASKQECITSTQMKNEAAIIRTRSTTSTTKETMSVDASREERFEVDQECASVIVEPADGYFERMRELSVQLAELNETTVRQLQDLNRNIAGLNTIYEIQLKSISSQLDTIDRVNSGLKDIKDMYEKSASESARYCEETSRMTKYMSQLNAVYENMLSAMTVNMRVGATGNNSNPFVANDTTQENDQ